MIIAIIIHIITIPFLNLFLSDKMPWWSRSRRSSWESSACACRTPRRATHQDPRVHDLQGGKNGDDGGNLLSWQWLGNIFIENTIIIFGEHKITIKSFFQQQWSLKIPHCHHSCSAMLSLWSSSPPGELNSPIGLPTLERIMCGKAQFHLQSPPEQHARSVSDDQGSCSDIVTIISITIRAKCLVGSPLVETIRLPENATLSRLFTWDSPSFRFYISCHILTWDNPSFIKLIQMTFGKHIERKHICFFPGEVFT